jgi:uracil-DNA glycosylase family 4
MGFPQEKIRDVIAYFKQLERKGIRSVYPYSPGQTAVESAPSIDEETTVTKVPADTDALTALRDTVSRCTLCPLHESRTQTVFGVGNPSPGVMFIGEAPGRDEDRKGEPFVGRAGQLLTKILAAIDLKRDDVYITNILKCRPPNNRDPQESEVRCCENYLKKQIELIQPQVICALGRIAAQWLLQTTAPLGTLRAGEYYYEGIRILPTYHPAALLRNPNLKKPAWEDFKKLKAMLDESDS